MNDRAASPLLVLALALTAGACSPPEKAVVDKYFNAVRAKDNQTLSSFAAVGFDKPVESWNITSTGEEKPTPVILPELVAKVKDLEAQLAANKKAAGAYNLDKYASIDKVQELKKKGATIPPGLAGVAAEWDKFNQKDKEIRKALASAKEAVEKEKRNVALSVGPLEGMDSLTGEMVNKQLELLVTLKDGKPEPYVMSLRRYNLKRETGPRIVSRWVIYGLEPKG